MPIDLLLLCDTLALKLLPCLGPGGGGGGEGGLKCFFFLIVLKIVFKKLFNCNICQ